MEELNELDNLDFFDDDYVTSAEENLENEQVEEPTNNLEEPEESEESNEPEDDLLTDLLRQKGILITKLIECLLIYFVL